MEVFNWSLPLRHLCPALLCSVFILVPGCKPLSRATKSTPATLAGMEAKQEKFPDVHSPDPKIPLQPVQEKYEIDFPFQTACISAKFPAGNTANKGIAVKLGNHAALCFDTDLLRVSAGWTGRFLNLKGVTYDGSHGGHPAIVGDQKFGTLPAPGWADENGQFVDRRPEPFGPISENVGRWNGLHVVGDYVVFDYTIGATRIQEQPSSLLKNGEVGFVRTFRVGSTKAPLLMAVCDWESGEARIQDGIASIGGASNRVLMVGLSGAPKGVMLERSGNSKLVLRIPKETAPLIFNLVIWQGTTEGQTNFPQFLAVPPTFVDFKKGGPSRWPQTVTTRGTLASSSTPDGAYVLDQLTAPEKNPWNRRIRFGGLDFFKDGTRAALSTWDGDVWIVSGIDDRLENLKWKWFAAGGFENLGLKIVNDVIYTTGRDQITRYHDVNGDGEADFYENFNNQISSSPGFHEFVFDLHTDNKGNFYTAKAGPVRGGGSGFGGGGGNGSVTTNAGTLMRITPDGKRREVIATGFRAPNGIGVGPNGEITTGDNEGTWVPACPLNWVKEGTFHGVETLAHTQPPPPYQKPLMWFSKAFDNSGGGQVWVTSDSWGPFKGELLHMSYGTSSLYLAMRNKVGDVHQAGVVKFPLKFTSSAMRARFNPRDGQLYVAGLRGWQSNAARETGLDRVRFTGKNFYSASSLRVVREGIQIGFTQPLDPAVANDLQSYSARQWNYKRTSNYGSDQYDPASEKKGQAEVEITAATLSPDGKTVTLKIASFQPVNQLLLKYDLKARDGTAIKQELLQTIHAIP